MTQFIKAKCLGCLNSFRLPDFHTYHKTLPLPPKPTIAGMLGSAAGLSPEEINDRLLSDPTKFQVGIWGINGGRANDLWQIRKYENVTIGLYKKGLVATPYKTAKIFSPYQLMTLFFTRSAPEKTASLLSKQFWKCTIKNSTSNNA